MKTNKYADLLRFGLTQKTLLTLSESTINTLHKNLIESKKETKEETKQTVVQSTYDTSNNADQQKLAQKGIKIDPVTKKITLNQGKEEKKNEKIIQDGEVSENKKVQKINPWAICHKQLGPKKTPKFERCVMAIKQSVKEGKNPFSVILENKILSLVEKHIKPKMKKGDLMDLISKKSMKTPITTLGSIDVTENTKEAPTKPTTKPGTKTPPKPDKDSPYKPKTAPAPKARFETKEQFVANAPTKQPTTKPGIKTPPKPDKDSPYKPKTAPAPKAKKSMPSWMSFDSIGIKLKK
jgi:hypothetical protein